MGNNPERRQTLAQAGALFTDLRDKLTTNGNNLSMEELAQVSETVGHLQDRWNVSLGHRTVEKGVLLIRDYFAIKLGLPPVLRHIEIMDLISERIKPSENPEKMKPADIANFRVEHQALSILYDRELHRLTMRTLSAQRRYEEFQDFLLSPTGRDIGL